MKGRSAHSVVGAWYRDKSIFRVSLVLEATCVSGFQTVVPNGLVTWLCSGNTYCNALVDLTSPR